MEANYNLEMENKMPVLQTALKYNKLINIFTSSNFTVKLIQLQKLNSSLVWFAYRL